MLQEDPELKPIFEEIQKGGMGAMMKYMNDATFLAKVGEKLGDVPMSAQPSQQQQAAPEINTLIDAAR